MSLLANMNWASVQQTTQTPIFVQSTAREIGYKVKSDSDRRKFIQIIDLSVSTKIILSSQS